MQKPIWFEINKKEFEELTRVIYSKQDNNDFKIIINKRTDDLKNAKKIQMEKLRRERLDEIKRKEWKILSSSLYF